MIVWSQTGFSFIDRTAIDGEGVDLVNFGAAFGQQRQHLPISGRLRAIIFRLGQCDQWAKSICAMPHRKRF